MTQKHPNPPPVGGRPTPSVQPPAVGKCGGSCKCSCKEQIANLHGVVNVLSGLLKDADEVLETCENDDMLDDSEDGDKLALLRERIEGALGQLVAAKLEGLPPLVVEERKAAELAFGLLWMIENHRTKELGAYTALSGALDKPAKARGIQAAIDAGYEADHPIGCDWWAGKKS